MIITVNIEIKIGMVMNKTFAKITVVLFALAVILPVLCSC